MASNIAWVSISNLVALVIGFASSILLARWLGPEARGIYALVVTTSIALAAFLGSDAWIQALTYLTGKKYYTPSQVAGHGVLIALAGAAVVAGLIIMLPKQVLDSFFPELDLLHLWIIVLLATSTLLFAMLTGSLMGLNQIPLFTSLKTAKAIVALLLRIVLLGFLSLGLEGALWELAASAILGISMTLAVFISRTGLDLRIQKCFMRDVTLYGARAYLGHLGVVLLNRVDIFFVALFDGVGAAGHYAVAKGLVEIVAMIEQSVSQGIIPDVVAADYTTAGSIVARAFRVTWWLNALVLLIGGVSARWLIPLVYGTEFAAVVPALLLLLPGFQFLTTRMLGIFYTMQIGRPEIPAYYILASGIISLPISYLLTRHFGYLGAAAAFSLIAVLRGIAAIVLFVVFSKVELRDVLLLSMADVFALPKLIPSWLRPHSRRDHKVCI